MKKNLLRRIILLTATLAAIVVICYGAALAYLAYESRRASSLLQDLSSVKLGDNEASVVPLTQKYGRYPYVPPSVPREVFHGSELGFDFLYGFGFDPLCMNRNNSHWTRFDSLIYMASTRIAPSLRRAMGLRRWIVGGQIGFKQGRVMGVNYIVLVEGTHEWLQGNWFLVPTIPAGDIDHYVWDAQVDWPQKNRYLIGEHFLLHGYEARGTGLETWITPSATPDEKRSARQFMLQCLTSLSGCQSVCDLVPAGVGYAKAGKWEDGRKQPCSTPLVDSW